MSEKVDQVQYIDLDKNIAESNSAFLKKLPKFIVKRLKKIICQQKLNDILNKYAAFEGLAFLEKIIEDFQLNLEISGKENLPENGRCFFAANHPFGILDGLILTHTVSSKYGKITAIANDAFMLLPHLRPIITEINVYGSSSKKRISALNKMYASELPITHFPAGEVSRVYEGKIQDTNWQKSFIRKAIEHNRSIVPIRFEGGNSNLFYQVYKLRKALGIGMNLELALLPREFFKKRKATIKMHIGKPIIPEQLTKTKSHDQWAQNIRAEVYSMA